MTIPLSEPTISGNEWKYIKECLDEGWVSSVGAYVDRFEKTVADYAGTKHGVATVNGTAALHAGLVACGVNSGDEVIVPTLTFIATANAVRYCGATPVFMDCDPETLCIDHGKVAEFLMDECDLRSDGAVYNKSTGARIKALIPVHVFGHPADMDALLDVSRRYNLAVIEDAAESLGSEYRGRRTGSLGSLGCFSFNGNKIATTGGGGMVVTDDKALAERIRHLTTQAKIDPIEYDHDEIGYNYRLTNIQAAMGVAQMERIDEFIEIKRRNAETYRELLSGMDDVELLRERPWARSNCWFYTIKVPKDHKDGLLEHLLKNGIQARPIWKLMHTLPMYEGSQTYRVEHAQEARMRSLNLPCSTGIKPGEIESVVKCIGEYFTRKVVA